MIDKNSKSSRPVEPAIDKGSARERTLAHLEGLMRAATAMVGTGLLVASSARAQDRPQVVDPPPPPPPECCENPDQIFVRGCIDRTANWHKSEGHWILTFRLGTWSPRIVSFEEIEKADIKLSGMALKELKTAYGSVTLTLAPVGDEKSPKLELPVMCKKKKLPLKFSLDLREEPEEFRGVPVKMVK